MLGSSKAGSLACRPEYSGAQEGTGKITAMQGYQSSRVEDLVQF
jgi:hypothetical protein